MMTFFGGVIGGAIIGQICFVYGKRVGRRLERDSVLAYMHSRRVICGWSRDDILAGIKRGGHGL